jgi:hypothetical protein
MKRLFVYLFLAACVSLIFMGCSNKNSAEACRHQVTLNLDKANYDAVLGSGCADNMQKGAANLGKAGFDIKNVVNRFIDAGLISSGTKTSDLSVYMNSLIGNVTPESLAYIDQSRTEYDIVCDNTPTTENAWKDANFYESVVDSIKALSLLKTVVDSNGTGKMSTCDMNDNNVPDEVDATSCALIASSRMQGLTTAQCKGATYAPLAPVEISLKDGNGNTVPGIYSGLVITMGGNPAAGCPASYRKLLYKDSKGSFWAATTSADTCTDANNNQWPCPLTGSSLDLVATIDQALTSAQSSLGNSLPGTESSDVKTALQDIKGQACCGCTSSPCAPCSSPCSSLDIAEYLQTITK